MALAVWFMMDGSFTGTRIKLHADSLSIDDKHLIIKVLHNKYVLYSYLRKNGKYWIIFMPATEFNKFKKIVHPYIHESMLYKLGMLVYSFYNFLSIIIKATLVKTVN